MNFKKIIKSISLGIAICACVSTGVQAGQSNLLTYTGTDIWDWRTINDFSLSSSQNVTVYHSQTRNTASSSTYLNVDVRKYAFVGSTSQFEQHFTGNDSGTFSGNLSKGKYFLRFKSSVKAQKFDIDGSVY
ncbi:Uncharacterised protein [Clostridium putrefaciens]|uniref:Uncharacterized protein n=1 Tax=Clostridium putrefaciens TaxID=99675 RepID=A0A381J445_9CLOT|nr:hypothetical protein [Clostridium putrefaciens]SUY44854.1 Uncharacterised protein [Clostridium putrefaciens]